MKTRASHYLEAERLLAAVADMPVGTPALIALGLAQVHATLASCDDIDECVADVEDRVRGFNDETIERAMTDGPLSE